MTKESILNLTEEEINLEIAKFMGLDVKECEGVFYYTKGSKRQFDFPNYCNDLNLVYQVEEKIKEKEFSFYHRYSIHLRNVLSHIDYVASDLLLIELIHASALERCRAILLTIKESEDNA